MDNAKKALNRRHLILIVIILTILFSSFILKPQLLVSQNNDLNAFAFPQFKFIKDAFINYKIIPSWQNKILGGYPLLGDPQSVLTYPFSYLALVMDLSTFFLIYFLFHAFVAIVSAYLLGRELKISQKGSLIAGLLYGITPKMVSHLEAGHTNLFASYAYIPLVFLFFYKLVKKPSYKKAIFFSFFLSLIYVLYITIFYYVVIILLLYFLLNFSGMLLKRFKYFVVSAIFFAGFILPGLLASIELFPQLTRGLLNYEDVSGQIFAWRQIFGFLFNPLLVKGLQTEMVLYLGWFALLLSVIGFINLAKRRRIFILILLITSFFYAAGPKTLFYKFLYNYFPGVSLLRVPTRMWFVVSLTLSILSGLGFDYLFKGKRKKTAIFLGVFCILEFLYLGVTKLYPHNFIKKNSIPAGLYSEYFSEEKNFFRIYCPVVCLTYYDAIAFNIGFTTGYNPVQLSNYFGYIQEAGGYKFGSYTLSIPPYQTFVDKPQPVAEMLGNLGVKYVISTYKLTDSNFELVNEKENYYLYKNLLVKPRAYLLTQSRSIVPLKILNDCPGMIELKGAGYDGEVILNEVYTKSWKVYKDGKRENSRSEANVTLSTPVTKNIQKVVFSYEPLGTPWSWYILIATYILAILVLTNKKIT